MEVAAALGAVGTLSRSGWGRNVDSQAPSVLRGPGMNCPGPGAGKEPVAHSAPFHPGSCPWTHLGRHTPLPVPAPCCHIPLESHV